MAVWLPRFRLDCRTCTESQKSHRGCEAKAKQPFILTLDNEKYELWNCPVNLITEITINIMKYWMFYRQGFLPAGGGINNQSAKMLQAFEILDNEKEKIRKEDEKYKRKL